MKKVEIKEILLYSIQTPEKCGRADEGANKKKNTLKSEMVEK